MGYLTTEAVENLSKHKYCSSEYSTFMNFLNRALWTPCSNFLPDWLAPNLITILSTVSIMFACFYAIGHNDLLFSATVPPDTMLIGAIGIFIYSLLDNLDGKQARRLGVSSPLGQLLDHGLDASVNALSIGLLLVQALNFHDSIMIPTLLVFMQLPCFFTFWEEYYCGIMKLQVGGLGADEFNFLSIGIMLVSYFSGTEFWDNKIFSAIPLNTLYVSVLIILFLIIGLPSFTSSVYYKTNTLKSFLLLIPPMQVYLGIYIFYFSEAYKHYALLFLIAGCALGGLLNCRLIISVTCNVEFKIFRLDTTLFFLFAIASYYYEIVNFWIAAGLCGAMTLYLFFYLYSISCEIAECLGINVLTVRKAN
ncbi:unnamed protein product [Blepharisma stoltei]|uniref:Ethanolaminephosphotransferase n=1 Tax=Blepharisma stoltei TaxID=1481888 RepID=A0AAU9J8V4_9CILI|nr:unnamed protein product [Blepharisma stoltei]